MVVPVVDEVEPCAAACVAKRRRLVGGGIEPESEGVGDFLSTGWIDPFEDAILDAVEVESLALLFGDNLRLAFPRLSLRPTK